MKLSYILLFFLFLILFKLPAQDTCSKYEQMSYVYAELNDSTASKYLDSLNGCSGLEATLFSRANILFKDGKYDEALVLYEKYINDNEKGDIQRSEACIYAGICAHNIKQYDKALKYYKQAEKLGFSPATVHYNIGITYVEMGDYLSAIKSYNKSLTYDSQYPNTWNNLGAVYEIAGDNQRSHKYYSNAYALSNKTDVLLLMNYGRALKGVNNYDSALIIFSEVLNISPNNCEAAIEIAKLYNFTFKNYKEGLKYARKAVASSATNSSAYFELAFALSSLGYKDSALLYYRITLKLDPQQYVAYTNSSTIYKLYGHFEKAIECNLLALEIAPNYSYAYRNLGHVYMEKKDFETSLKYNMLCYKYSTDKSEKALGLGYAYLNAGYYDSAIKYLKESIIDRYEHFDVPYNNIGLAFIRLNNLDSAKYYLDIAYSINNKNSFNIHNKALYYYKIGYYDSACTFLKHSIDLEYNWIIDSSLERMAENYCQDININRKINFYGYKGHFPEYSDKNFIDLIDSLSTNHFETIVKPQMYEIKEAQSSREEKSASASKYTIYPNPNTGVFTFVNPTFSGEETILDIYNANGQKVDSRSILGSTSEISLNNLDNGLYVAVILQNNNVVHTEKIIIQQ